MFCCFEKYCTHTVIFIIVLVWHVAILQMLQILMPGPWIVVGGWCWHWWVRGDAVVVTWVAILVLESGVEIVGVEFDGSGGWIRIGWWDGMPWWRIALGNGARLVVIWGAGWTLGCNSDGRTHRRTGRAHARINNLPRRLVSFMGPSVSLILAPLLLVEELLLTELFGANLLLFPLACRGGSGGSSGFLGSEAMDVVSFALFPGLGALLFGGLAGALLLLLFSPFSRCFSLKAEAALLLRLAVGGGGGVGVGGGSDAGLGASRRLGWIGCWFGRFSALVFPPFPLRFSTFSLLLLLLCLGMDGEGGVRCGSDARLGGSR